MPYKTEWVKISHKERRLEKVLHPVSWSANKGESGTPQLNYHYHLEKEIAKYDFDL